ncbi:MAG: DHH family phosphoesterase [Bacillota bacterium]|jgi:phosphoesterase RecJ-like protein
MQMTAALREASRLLLVAHVAPDGDSLGSLLALQRGLSELGKSAAVFVPDGIPAKYRFLPGWEQVVAQSERLPADVDRVVVLDCGEWDRTRLPQPYRHLPTLNIDHHRTSVGIGEYNLIDPAVAATGELVYKILIALRCTIDAEIATCLYTAIVSDTGWFRFSNTTADVHRLAAELLQLGAWHEQVNDWLNTRTEEYLQAMTLVLERIALFAERQAAISWLELSDLQRIGIAANDIEGLIDYPRSLPVVKVAALLVETSPRTYKVSLRSRHPIDVSQVASEFGGGGHARAAGCTISDAELQQAVARVRGVLERSLGIGTV